MVVLRTHESMANMLLIQDLIVVISAESGGQSGRPKCRSAREGMSLRQGSERYSRWSEEGRQVGVGKDLWE